MGQEQGLKTWIHRRWFRNLLPTSQNVTLQPLLSGTEPLSGMFMFPTSCNFMRHSHLRLRKSNGPFKIVWPWWMEVTSWKSKTDETQTFENLSQQVEIIDCFHSEFSSSECILVGIKILQSVGWPTVLPNATLFLYSSLVGWWHRHLPIDEAQINLATLQ